MKTLYSSTVGMPGQLFVTRRRYTFGTFEERQDFEQKALARFGAKRDTANVEVLVTVDEALADLQREREHDLRVMAAGSEGC